MILNNQAKIIRASHHVKNKRSLINFRQGALKNNFFGVNQETNHDVATNGRLLNATHQNLNIVNDSSDMNSIERSFYKQD